MGVYVGMDVHRRRSQVAVVDEAGVPQRNRNLASDPATLVPVLGALPPGTPVAFEAAYGWSWLVELLEEPEPHLVHPSRCKAIASARLQEIHAVLADRGIGEDQVLWTGPGRAWLADLALPPTPRAIIKVRDGPITKQGSPWCAGSCRRPPRRPSATPCEPPPNRRPGLLPHPVPPSATSHRPPPGRSSRAP